ncbi:MAG: DUF4317 domain-containing protein [Clostridia bacterium]
MNEKEIAEIRRRFRPDKSNISRIRGCYVNLKGEIVSEFNQSLGMMSQDETEEILSILKKTLSGKIEKNLIDIEFSTNQVLDSDEHKLLMRLKNSNLEDDVSISEFFGRVIKSLTLECNYLILLSCDKYDVFSYSKDGEKSEDSTQSFTYILCSICPIKSAKPALSYFSSDATLRNSVSDSLVSAPELGFMFPAFDDRSANIYDALYYTRNISESHTEFVDAVFKTEIPMPAALQKETFAAVLEQTVSEDCSYDVVQSIHGKFTEMIEDHKTAKEVEPLVISKKTVKNVLESCGVSDSRITSFEEKFDTEFGTDTKLAPQNIVDTKQFELRTADVTIKVNPEHSDLVETRIIDGTKYILIRANDNVEVNGVNIHI